jgi:hypothetical protein
MLVLVQQALFVRCDGVNVGDLLTSQLDQFARGMRKEMRKECDLATCRYDVAAGASLKLRSGGKFKVDARNSNVSFARSVDTHDG